jgi:hypothetical protein
VLNLNLIPKKKIDLSKNNLDNVLDFAIFIIVGIQRRNFYTCGKYLGGYGFIYEYSYNYIQKDKNA